MFIFQLLSFIAPNTCPDLRGLRRVAGGVAGGVTGSEHLPRLEGIETIIRDLLRGGGMTSEHLPRLEGIET